MTDKRVRIRRNTIALIRYAWVDFVVLAALGAICAMRHDWGSVAIIGSLIPLLPLVAIIGMLVAISRERR